MTASPCNVKQLFDTEFEASIAASKAEYRYKSEMVPYKCGTHWHIANQDRRMRSRNRPSGKTYCAVCDVYMKKKRWDTHVTKQRHKTLEKKKAPDGELST